LRERLTISAFKQPSLIVNDLKNGEESAGAVGLFVDVGTEGYFRDLKIVAAGYCGKQNLLPARRATILKLWHSINILFRQRKQVILRFIFIIPQNRLTNNK
jgi:hypothetical protein